MEIAILTEGGTNIGLGHLARCCSLTHEFRKIRSAAKIKFIITGDKEAVDFLKANGLPEIINFDWIHDTEKTLRLTRQSKLILVDSYRAPKSLYHKLYVERLFSRLAVIDDYNRLAYDADIVITPSICKIKEAGYQKREGITYLAGPQYIALRKEFCVNIKKRINREVRNILITFGGRDYSSFFARITDTLLNYPFRLHIVVPAISKLHLPNNEKIRIYRALTAIQMRSLMLKADLCISAGGQTLYELAAMAVPIIGICFADNQKLNLKCFKKQRFIEFAGWHTDKNIVEKLNRAVLKLLPYKVRKQRSKIGKKIIDGMGTHRLAEFLIGRGKSKIKLSPAEKTDCIELLRWRNHPLVRRWCFNAKRIDLKTHRKWFYSSLGNSAAKIYIAKQGTEKVGVIRFADTAAAGVLTNINLNPDFLHRGLGTEIIKLGTEKILKTFKKPKAVIAKIKNDNYISQKAFRKAGYVLSRELPADRNSLTMVYNRYL